MLQRERNWTFGVIWLGQLVSLIGSGLSAFAFGVWIYQRSDSITQLALVTLFTFLPNVVLAPFAGALVDRWDRRWTMILSDSGSAASTLALAALLFAGRLEAWHIYVGVTVSGAFGVFQGLAYPAAVTMLVPKEQLGRANGMVQAIYAAGQLVSPILAGALFVPFGLEGIVLIDGLTFLFSLVTLLMVRIPRPPTTAEGDKARGSLLYEAAYGWRYIVARPGLFSMLLFAATTNFSMGVVEVLVTPLVLSFASAAVVGTVLSVGGSGMLIGSVVMSAWGGPRRRMYGVFGFTLLQGLALVIGGLHPSALLVAAAAFLFLFSSPIIIGSGQAIWQSKVQPDVQGRVFAIRGMVSWATFPLAYLLAGPLADRIFEPLMAADGPLANSVGGIIGAGPGRGIALLIIALGCAMILAAAVGYSYPRLRLVEDELEDFVLDDGAERIVEGGALVT